MPRPVPSTCLVLLLVGEALAQPAPTGGEVPPSPAGVDEPAPTDEQAPTDEAVPPDTATQAAEPEDAGPSWPPASLQDGWWWVRVGPRGVTGFVDVAAHPDSEQVWAATTAAGAVWLTHDAGQSWLAVLQPVGSGLGEATTDEDVLLDVEARIDEVSGDLAEEIDLGGASEEEVEELLDDIQDQSDEAASAADEAIQVVQSELEGGAWFLDEELGAGRATRTRAWFTAGGVLVVGRPDGLHVSGDLGASWTQALDEPVLAFAEVDGAFVAGTPSGLLRSVGLLRWEVQPGLDATVIDLVVDGELWIATSEGVWRGLDGPRPLNVHDGATLTVRPALPPDRGEVPLLVAEPADVRRASREGEPGVVVFGGPLPRTLEMVRVGEKLVAASADGPFESIDAGLSWTPVSRGLTEPATHAVEVLPDTLLLASAGGLYRLEPLPPDLGLEELEIEEWIPLTALLRSSLEREELRQRVGSRLAAALLPQLTLQGELRRSRDLSWTVYSEGTSWTTGVDDEVWGVQARLRWTPNRQRSSTSFDRDISNLGVLVVDGDVWVDDGGVPPMSLYSQVGRGATSYRAELVDQIGQLYRARARLVGERQQAAAEELLARVELELEVAELEARLDVLTDGAVSRWRTQPGDGTREE